MEHHLLKVMWLMFRREAFSAEAEEGRTFHRFALDEGRNWESKVRENLSDVVFGQVFPNLMRARKRADPDAPEVLDAAYLGTVRDAAFTLLYRLLFALYAEDRDLLPKREPNYGGLSRLRDEIAERIDAATALSGRRKTFARICAELFVTIDEGDDTLGVPPYNGAFSRTRQQRPNCLTALSFPTQILRHCSIVWPALTRTGVASASISAIYRYNSSVRFMSDYWNTSR